MDDDDKDGALSAFETTRYRRIAARANFLAQDRMDIASATKEATRRMTAPTKGADNCEHLWVVLVLCVFGTCRAFVFPAEVFFHTQRLSGIFPSIRGCLSQGP